MNRKMNRKQYRRYHSPVITAERERIEKQLSALTPLTPEMRHFLPFEGFAESLQDGTYTVTAMKETIERSNIGLLKVGDKVNVERSMMMNGRLDGHIVQGHVDQTAECMDIKDAEGSWYFTFRYAFDKEMAKRGYITVDKGSVTVNGVSLTVCNPTEDTF